MDPPRRRRPPLSCITCRRRKLKCDRCCPCAQCIKSKIPNECSYVINPARHDASLPEGPEDNAPAGTAAPVAGRSMNSGLHVFDSRYRVSKASSRQDELQDLRGRVKALENAIVKQGAIATPETLGDGSDAEVRPQGIGEDVAVLPESCFRGKNDSTKYVGRSNYALTMWLFKDVGAFLSRKSSAKDKSTEATMERLKTQLWSRERQEHQRAYREHAFKLEEMLPSRAVADQLLDLYMSTFETTHRILHVPTFLQQYETYWADSQNADMVFLAKLLALMAVSSCFFSSTTKLDGRESLHQAAARWTMAVQSWVTSVFVGSNINLDMLQIQCLLLVARQADAMDGDIIWITSGSLTRSAMTMGLHRCPRRFTPMYRFWAEMRRRVWATIVELDLQSSTEGGMPPSIDLDECDCEAPSNWDDSDISEGMLFDPGPPEAGVVTRSDFQLLLSRSLSVRLRITKLVNSLRFTLSYDEALRLSDELIRYMDEGVALFDREQHTLGFARSSYMFLMRKYLLMLHRPFCLSSLQNPRYTYSRKLCLESSLEILSQLEVNGSYAHLGQLAGSMLRHEFFHAAITVCVELRLQTEETKPGRNSLTDLVQSQQSVMLRAVERTIDALERRLSGKAGKAYIFLSMVYASVKARLTGEDTLDAVGRVSSQVVGHCKETMGVQEDRTPPLTTVDPVLPDWSDLSTLDFGSLFDFSDYGRELWTLE